jgi:hypothetical protein
MSRRHRPEIEFTARVAARELRFEEVPETKVEFPDGIGESRSRRHNLPDKVEAGVTYRNVVVDYRLAAALRETERSGEDDEENLPR